MNPNFRKPVLAMVVSAAAVVGITKHEGLRLDAYRPLPTDVPTIGVGTTVYPDGKSVQLGDKITRKQAEEYLQHDLGRFQSAMSKCIKVPLYQYEYDAYVSLTYNIGSGAFCGSTLVKRLNQYDYAGACQEILKWDKFQGKPLKGLTNRRNDEYKQCIGE